MTIGLPVKANFSRMRFSRYRSTEECSLPAQLEKGLAAGVTAYIGLGCFGHTREATTESARNAATMASDHEIGIL